MIRFYKITLVIVSLLLLFCLSGCKSGATDYTSMIELDTSSNTDGTASVPIVIVDDEEDNSSSTKSDIDNIIDQWENKSPELEIEVGNGQLTEDSDKDKSSSGGSSDTTTSNEQETDSNNSSVDSSDSSESQEQGSSDSSTSNSSDENSGDTDSKEEDDGYFDVAV